MSSFMSASLQVPVISTTMERLEKFLGNVSYEVKPISTLNAPSNKIDDTTEVALKFVARKVSVQFSSEFSSTLTKKAAIDVNCKKLEAFLTAVRSTAATDFCILAEALVGSLELSYGDLMAYDKSAYCDLITSALGHVKQLSQVTNDVKWKPSSIYVAPFENDFLLVVARIMQEFSQGRPVILSCSSARLMVPLFAFANTMITASPPAGLLSFIPIKKTLSKDMPFSSIQMILKSSDIDSASRAVVKASAYHAGTTSWRPCVVLVEQDLEREFHTKVKSLISESPNLGDTAILDKNSHLRGHCHIPSYIKSEFESYINASVVDGAELVRPNQESGPVFIFGLAPASAILDRYKKFPLGPCSMVIPFRTANEGIKLAQYFSDREKCILGAGELINNIPKSATIWTDNSALSLQVLAKLTGYTTLAVNSNMPHLCSSYYLSESSTRNSVKFPGLAIPKDELCDAAKQNKEFAVELMKMVSATDGITLAWKKLTFDQRLSALESLKEFSVVASLVEKLRSDCLSYVSPISQPTLGEEIATAFSAERLLLLRKWQEPAGPIFVILTSDDLLPEFVQLSICCLVLGNPVVLLVPKSVSPSSELRNFCDTVSLAISSKIVDFAKLPRLLQVQTVSMEEKEVVAALSSLPFKGISCVSAPVDTVEMADLDISKLCKHTSVFWSVGGDLFAN